MKCYIYCTKSKPNIGLNGEVVACFDLNKVEKMGLDTNKGLVFDSDYNKESCLSLKELVEYIGNNYYYAWYIENLEIFDKPLDLGYFIETKRSLFTGWFERVKRPPQSWFRVFNRKSEICILISIKPEWVKKILNGEKTIEIRKTAPRELLK